MPSNLNSGTTSYYDAYCSSQQAQWRPQLPPLPKPPTSLTPLPACPQSAPIRAGWPDHT